MSFKMENNEADQDEVKVDMLPCQYKNDVQKINREIFFDPCIVKREDQLLEVNLQGRKMVGKDIEL